MPRLPARVLTGILILFSSLAFHLPATEPDAERLAAAERLAPFFFIPATTTVALSPDGQKAAFDLRANGQISIITIDLDRPETPLARVLIASDEAATSWSALRMGRNTLGRVELLQWIDDNRVVACANITGRVGVGKGVVFAFNANGTDARMLLSGLDDRKSYHPAAYVRDPTPRLLLTMQSDFGRDREYRFFDPVADRLLPPLTEEEKIALAAALLERREADEKGFEPFVDLLETSLPDHRIQFQRAAPASTRRVARVQRLNDPGSFVIVDLNSRVIWDLARYAPAHAARRKIQFETFDFTDDEGRRYQGMVSTPHFSLTERAPVVVYRSQAIASPTRNAYEPLVAAINEMGFAVIFVHDPDFSPFPEERFLHEASYSGAGLLGPSRAPPRDPAERAQLREAHAAREETQNRARPIHLGRALDLLAERYHLSRRAVALFDNRNPLHENVPLLVTESGRFRCAVLFNLRERAALSGLEDWRAHLKRAPEAPIAAVLAIYNNGIGPREGASREKQLATNLQYQLKRKDVPVETMPAAVEALTDEAPDQLALLCADIERFLNQHLYTYATEIGELEVRQ